MLLVAVSDSHDNIAAIKKLGDALRSRGVSLVIHAGDWVSPFTARFLRERPYFLEVAKKFNVEIAGDAAELEVAGRKIAVYHGTSPVLLKALAESGLYDIVIYGHTHQAVIEKRGRTLVVNPGELCGCLTGRSSYALINVEKLEVDLIYLT